VRNISVTRVSKILVKSGRSNTNPGSIAHLTNFPTYAPMCGRVIQSSGPLCYGIVEGMDMRDSRAHNYPPRWNAAPSQELLVIRRNHETGVVSLDPLRLGFNSALVPRSQRRAQADQRQMRDGT
jgi:hypothetical protein